MEERDLDAVVVACRDPDDRPLDHACREPYERADAEGFLRYGRAAWAEGTAACFVIADADDAYAGTIDLRLSPADPLRRRRRLHDRPARPRSRLPCRPRWPR